ncbi:DUF922 domain-containing protein [Chitinilyticum aquatile]|uniref:DUF922 domain-containing protein n=1 Tax=Chitinilyticum aquatile TaxID=362520 RepID=UPI0003F669DD|nr:DUF922 domain-containing protein [Chitinilyticum aquatile]
MRHSWLQLFALVPVLLSGHAGAELRQSVEYEPYPLYALGTGRLADDLNRASPIREQGKIFYGYTSCHTRWDYRWNSAPSGECRIASSLTTVRCVVQLPQLIQATPAKKARFDVFLPRLKEHELGHVQIGTDAAARIDQRIMGMPAAASCDALEAAINRETALITSNAAQAQRDYDLRTGYGRSQGAFLD